ALRGPNLRAGPQQSDPGPDVDVTLQPERRQRREIVRVRGRERHRWIALRRLEAARVALEVQHSGREDTPPLERRRHFLRYGAEVFADHERVVPDAFERENPE